MRKGNARKIQSHDFRLSKSFWTAQRDWERRLKEFLREEQEEKVEWKESTLFRGVSNPLHSFTASRKRRPEKRERAKEVQGQEKGLGVGSPAQSASNRSDRTGTTARLKRRRSIVKRAMQAVRNKISVLKPRWRLESKKDVRTGGNREPEREKKSLGAWR